MTRDTDIVGCCRNCKFGESTAWQWELGLVECTNPDAHDHRHILDRWHGCGNFRQEGEETRKEKS